ncbi:MAG: hypothetical protein HUU20_12680 [Pirellulales bacterium]|nr:hypothetical protein [Pirellulales bacterium]
MVTRFRKPAGLAVLIGLGMACLVWAADPPPAGQRSVDAGQLRPQWQMGDQWIVETVSLPVQVRSAGIAQAKSQPIRWQFAVQKYEKVVSDDCYRVEIRCLEEGQQPTTVLWIDKKSQALKQMQTQIPVPGGFRTVSESYEFASGQPSPVLSPISALPVDLPLFQSGQSKGSQTFTYEANVGAAGTKAVGDLGFAYEIQQEIVEAQPDQVKGLVAEGFAKSLENKPVVEVKLKRFDRQVRQLWQPGQPWPVYSSNGTTTCRLIEVIPAEKKSQ